MSAPESISLVVKKARKAKKQQRAIVVAAPKRRTRRPRARSTITRQPSQIQAYVDTLNDPFDNGAVKLGWGTMATSGVATAYLRTTLATNADGSLGLALFPSLSNSLNALYYNNAGAGVATWNSAAWTNLSSLQAACNETRVVSIGLKALPNVAATAAPGYCYAGAFPSVSGSQVAAATINGLIASPLLKFGTGLVGAVACGRPQDPTSFEFFNTEGLGATTLLPTTVPIILFTGLPASSNVLIEAVMNLEFLPQFTDASLLLEETGEDNNGSEIVSNFTNIESMWNTIKSKLVPPALVDAVENLANRGMNAAIRGATMGAFSALRNKRSMREVASGAVGGAVEQMLRTNLFGSTDASNRVRNIVTR